eukprot:maker-scaffold10_size831480-snap-gene-7.25 protein:Tk01848 transcript:maker-scaffold10_size831480-snap-gene-7.25-mRNA-1 annotation:"glycerol kinase 5"
MGSPQVASRHRSDSDMARTRKFVLGLDVGTTKVRAFVYDRQGTVLGEADERVALVYPHTGWVEIVPDRLWDAVLAVIKKAQRESGIPFDDISCLGISTLRATFVTWNKNTGREFHNFITWKDVRADSLVKSWNHSFTMKTLRAGSGALYFLTRQKRFKVASILSLQNKMVNMRLLWALQNIPSFAEAAKNNNAMFGTVDTWLLYKLTQGAHHFTDVGNASATGLYDPFTMQYGDWAFKLFGIPQHIMPEVVDSAGTHFGQVHESLFGSSIPIRAVMADQSAAAFGSGCFELGDTKMTLGTGSFLDVNSGQKPHASINGLVPVIGWQVKESLVYLAEGCNHDTSSVIEWGLQMKLFQDPDETSDIAQSVSNSDFSLYFVPAFCGLQAPISDPSAAAGLIGLSPKTTSPELVRAILESIAFTMKQLVQTFEEESDYQLKNIQIDGGVSRNDFIVQMISNLTGKNISRALSSEMSAFGAAFMAGLNGGVWDSRSSLTDLRSIETRFEPVKDEDYLSRLDDHYERWIDACYRFTHWNNGDGSTKSILKDLTKPFSNCFHMKWGSKKLKAYRGLEQSYATSHGVMSSLEAHLKEQDQGHPLVVGLDDGRASVLGLVWSQARRMQLGMVIVLVLAGRNDGLLDLGTFLRRAPLDLVAGDSRRRRFGKQNLGAIGSDPEIGRLVRNGGEGGRHRIADDLVFPWGHDGRHNFDQVWPDPAGSGSLEKLYWLLSPGNSELAVNWRASAEILNLYLATRGLRAPMGGSHLTSMEVGVAFSMRMFLTDSAIVVTATVEGSPWVFLAL